MLLTPEKSLCEKNAAIVVSRDRGAQREHRANNPQKAFDLRHYKLDGVLIQQTKCCDFLLVNDSRKKAYLIELKGGNIDDAVEQLEAGEQKCKEELIGYTFSIELYAVRLKHIRFKTLSFESLEKNVEHD